MPLPKVEKVPQKIFVCPVISGNGGVWALSDDPGIPSAPYVPASLLETAEKDLERARELLKAAYEFVEHEAIARDCEFSWRAHDLKRLIHSFTQGE